ncbi:Os06g0331500, partial [Oryza sativa Japonica Group]
RRHHCLFPPATLLLLPSPHQHHRSPSLFPHWRCPFPHQWAVAPFLLVGVHPPLRSLPYPAGRRHGGSGSGSSLSLSTSP